MRLEWLVCLALGLALLPPPAWAEKPVFHQQVFLTESQALAQVFQELAVDKKTIRLTSAQKARVEQQLGRKVKETSFTFHIGKKDGQAVRYALILNEKGKHYPITFIVSLNAQARVEQVAVMVYREKIGVEVKHKRFLAQFKNKGGQDPVRVNVDIINLTGATISSWAVANGVKKAIVLTQLLRP